MVETLITLWLMGGLGWAWSASRAANEAAREYGRRACDEAGVQWLDQSVQLVVMRLRRRPDGWLSLERQFRFDYTRDGETRQGGRLVLLGTRLVGFTGPDRPQPEG